MTLAGAGYLDDARFAAARAAALAERESGDALIRHDLEERGIEAGLIEHALAGLAPEGERARDIVRRRGSAPSTGRRLSARGFTAEAVQDALGRDIADGGGDVVG